MKVEPTIRFSLASLFFLLMAPRFATPQSQTAPRGVRRDQQALALLQQALKVADWQAPANSVFDFKASGTITYLDGDNQIAGAATVLGRGAHQFSLTAQLPGGTRSLTVNQGKRALKVPSGREGSLSQIDQVNMGVMTLPYPGMAEALADPTAWIGYVGIGEVSGRQIEQIHVRKRLPFVPERGRENLFFSSLDYFIDSQTFEVVRIAETSLPVDPSWTDDPHEIDFANYQNMNGLLVPLSVSEKSMGRVVWQFQMTAISFNNGLTEASFALDAVED